MSDIRGMVRRSGHSTSVEAAQAISVIRTDLHQQVISAFKREGGLTDWELETLPEFSAYGPSTIRKRRSELYQWGFLEEAGKRKNPNGKNMKVWKLSGGGKQPQSKPEWLWILFSPSSNRIGSVSSDKKDLQPTHQWYVANGFKDIVFCRIKCPGG